MALEALHTQNSSLLFTASAVLCCAVLSVPSVVLDLMHWTELVSLSCRGVAIGHLGDRGGGVPKTLKVAWTTC